MKLTRTQFAEWKQALAEMRAEQINIQKIELEIKLLNSEAEKLALRSELRKLVNLDQAKKTYETKSLAQEKLKEKIEKSIGASLNGKTINEDTLEVTDVP